MQKIKLNIVALANSENQPNSYVVVLKEEEGNRRLPVVIGGFEAQAIVTAIENIRPNRPLTHDLIKNTLHALHIELKEVVISDLKEGIFYATLVCLKDDGSMIGLDSRTSDALALAVRVKCPIFVQEGIMDEAGISFEEPVEPKNPDEPSRDITALSPDELEEELEKALSDEDYERAAQIRDEISRRK